MSALTRRLGRAVRSPYSILALWCAALGLSVLVLGVAAPVPAPPTAILVLLATFLGVSVGDEALHPGVLVGLALVALDQRSLGTPIAQVAVLVVLPWVAYRVACNAVAGPIRRFHGWLPARPPLAVWPWPAVWLAFAVLVSALASHFARSEPEELLLLGGGLLTAAALALWSAIPGRAPSAREAVRVALMLAAGSLAAATVASSDAAPPGWERAAVVVGSAGLGATLGVALARGGKSRRSIWSRLLPLSYTPAFIVWAAPAVVTTAGAAYVLLGGEGGGAGRVAGLGLALLLLGGSAAAVPLLWGLEYGVVDWARKRRQRPDPVPGLDLLRAEILGRPFPRPGSPPHRLFVMTRDGGRLTVVLEGDVCLNDRSYQRQDPAQWLCPLRATVEISGRLDAEAGRLEVSGEDGAWIRALPASRDTSLTKRGVTGGLRVAAGLLLVLGAAQLVEARIEPRYQPPCRRLFRDPGTIRAPLVPPERCQQLLAQARRERRLELTRGAEAGGARRER